MSTSTRRTQPRPRQPRTRVEPTSSPEDEMLSEAVLRAASLEQFRLSQAKVMTEAALLLKVRQLAGALGWLCYHTHRSDRSEPGFPDVVLVRGETTLWRELKSQTGAVRPAQTRWLETLVAAGQDAGLWRPLDYLNGTVEAVLRGSR